MARILQVCNTDFYLGKFLAPLVRALVARGHVVECACEGRNVDAGVLPEGTVIHSVEFPKKGSLLQFHRAVQNLRKLIRSGRYDCVDSHNRNGSIVGRVAAWLENVPINLYTAHGFYFHDDQSFVAKEATIGLEAALARITDFTLSQSQADVDLMVSRRLIDKRRIITIRNGIDTQRFSPSIDRARAEARLSLRPGRFRVSATGRLVKGKGFNDLLDAFTNLHHVHPDTELLVIGGNIDQDISPFQDQFLEAVENRRLRDHVVVTGITKCVEQYLACTDVFVLPSYREGVPRALLEAMAMEIPVIATYIRGCREIIVPGDNGLLYPPHDVARLSALLMEAYEDRARIRTLGKRGRERVLERFDEEAYVAAQIEVIDRLLEGLPFRLRSSKAAPKPAAMNESRALRN